MSRSRALTALLTFVVAVVATNAAFARMAWFPHAAVHRFPAWTPVNLGLVDEALKRARARAEGGPWAVLLGDSIPHADMWGRPSESLGAVIARQLPVANLTSPSLGYAIMVQLLVYSLNTGAPAVIVPVNIKWVKHEWTPEKFGDLQRDVAALGNPRRLPHRLADYATLKAPRAKLRFRVTNLSLRGTVENGLKPELASSWKTEMALEATPNHDLRTPESSDAAMMAEFRKYHGVDWADIDGFAPLNALIAKMAAAPDRVFALVLPMNPRWDAALGTTEIATANKRRLEEKLRAQGIRVIETPLMTPDDFHDDQHLSVRGAERMGEAIAAAVLAERR